MPQYTYIFADLRTGAILNELPLYGVSFARELGGFGDWTGTIALDREGYNNQHVVDATLPGRTALFVDRDGTIVYAGIAWTRTYSAQSKTLQMTGQDLASYFAKRLISSRFPTLEFTNTDQFAIMQSLLNQAQAIAGGNIGVVVPTNLSGILRSHTYKASELKPVAEAINQISDNINGFDWEIDARYDSSKNIIKEARFGYPHLGRPLLGTDLIWEFPGGITNYWYTEAASDSATTQWAVGQGDGDTNLISVRDNNSFVDTGYPVLERQSSYNDVSVPETLDGHAEADLARYPIPLISPVIHVRADAEPVFGSYDLGDHAQFHIVDAFFPGGKVLSRRITGWRLSPGGSDETVQLVTGDPRG